MLKRIMPLIILLISGGLVAGLILTTTSNPAQIMPTVAAFPTDTPPPSSTPEPSDTPAPTVTPSLDDQLYKVVDEAIQLPLLQAETNPTGTAVLIRFEMLDNNLTVTLYQLQRVFCHLRQSGLVDGYTYQIRARGQFVDQYGNNVDRDGFAIRLQPDAIAQVNCDNIESVNWQAIAEYYEVHPLIEE